MTNTLVKELIAFAALIAVAWFVFALGRKKHVLEGKGGIESQARQGLQTAGAEVKTGWPAGVVLALKAALILGIFMVPVYFQSDPPYSFYTDKDASVKVAFKHIGKKVVNCDEAEVIKSEGERYRKTLKKTSRVQMNMARFADCPRERFPVHVSLSIDGREVLDRSYAPTGLKKDMASYVYDEFIIAPGRHKLSARLSDSGRKDAPDYTFEETVDIKPAQIRLIMFDDTLGRLVAE